MQDAQHIRQFDADKAEMETLNKGSQFTLREGDHWLRFWIPGME